MPVLGSLARGTSVQVRIGERQVNQQKALWRKAPREVEADQYKNLYRQITLDSDDPLLHIHLSTDAPVARGTAINAAFCRP